MAERNLLIIGLMSLTLVAVSGCAHKITKSDAASPPAASPAAQSQLANAAPSPAAQAAAPTAPAAAAQPNPPVAAAQSTATPSTPPPAAKAADAAQPQGAAATLSPLPPRDVMDTIKRMTNNRMTRYLSRTAQYDFYVGGRLDALYDIGKTELTIQDEDSSHPQSVTCEFSKDGEMISSAKPVPSKIIDTCNSLVNELNTYLSR
jgi:hypothetical protein